jgi:membrane-associated protease RseP (regulator of RpoE activity)
MRHGKLNFLAAAALAAATGVARAQGGDPSLEQRLADAQRRLEDAAREVAELSSEAGGNDFRQFEYFVPGPRRAMLGINLGGAEPNGGGVRIESVSPGGPAEEAGVKAGDVIVAVQSKPVATGRELVRAMESVEAGDKVELALRRAGKPVKLAVEARPFNRALLVGAPGVPGAPLVHALPAQHPFDGMPHGGMHWLLADWGDAEFVTLTPGLGRYFGAEKGVLVARAPEGQGFGLQDGDVILAIGGREPQTGSHAMRILRSYQPGESVEFRILRDRRVQTLAAKIPERDVLGLAPARVPAPPPAPPPPRPPAAPDEDAAAT